MPESVQTEGKRCEKGHRRRRRRDEKNKVKQSVMFVTQFCGSTLPSVVAPFVSFSHLRALRLNVSKYGASVLEIKVSLH